MDIHGEKAGIYIKRIEGFKERSDILKRKKLYVALLRLLTVILIIIAISYGWHANMLLTSSAVVAGLAIFIFLVSLSTDYTNAIKNIDQLISINKQELEVLKYNYTGFADGKEFAPRPHYYAEDLDIFGKASVFQYINRCTSDQSRKLLASHLTNGLSQEEIVLQQQAVQELTPMIDWRQQFLAFGKASPISFNTEQRIMSWLELEKDLFAAGYWKVVANLFPVFILLLIASLVARIMPPQIFFVLILLATLFAFYCSKKINRTHQILTKAVNEVKTLYDQINWLEKQTFTSNKIVSVKKTMAGNDQVTVSKEIFRLNSILDRFDMRLNVLAFFFLNIVFLWDLRQMLALNDWKKRNSKTIRGWFNAIAELEVLTSIASLAFNEPQWAYPQLTTNYFTFEGEDIGHPLIDKKIRIVNSFSLDGLGKVAMITGSNMGGKSTFLRSIGVNVVLSMMGAPVCAKSLKLSPTRLMSSMRIADNLAESTSTFYAELKRLQMIIEEVNRKGRVFILLDEILRGTNSLDRHIGSKALVKQLIDHDAVAIIATHDVALSEIGEAFDDAITNYHFDVQVSNDELFFDYKLKDGICTTLNASILMRKIGIEL